MIENNDLNRDLLKLSFLQRVESIPRSKLSLDDFMPSDGELDTLLNKHKKIIRESVETDDLIKYLECTNIDLSEFLEYQLYLLDVTSSDAYKKLTLGFMYRLVIAKKCRELYTHNFYSAVPIPKLEE